jgi:hypothetical protein
LNLSFKPVAEDSVNCVADISLDSGKTWGFDRNFCDRIDKIGLTRAAPNVKRTIHLRLRSGDTGNIAFKVTGQIDTTKLTNLRKLGTFDGWTECDSSYTTYSDELSMARIMDGYYSVYLQNGMVNGFVHTLSKQGTFTAKPYAMECGTQARAKALYQAKKPTMNTVKLAFPDSVAIGKSNLSGISAFAHFRHFYFEILLSGYTVQDSAVAHANTLLNFYKSKLGL